MLRSCRRANWPNWKISWNHYQVWPYTKNIDPPWHIIYVWLNHVCLLFMILVVENCFNLFCFSPFWFLSRWCSSCVLNSSFWPPFLIAPWLLEIMKLCQNLNCKGGPENFGIFYGSHIASLTYWISNMNTVCSYTCWGPKMGQRRTRSRCPAYSG